MHFQVYDVELLAPVSTSSDFSVSASFENGERNILL